MKKIAILSLSLLAAGVGMSLPGTVRAADEPTASSSQSPVAKDHESMMGGDMQAMSKMMAQMNQMMEKCDKMMQKMDDRKTK
ncbi:MULTISPECIES: hypothetical protein [unclassified Bradyrhizobium]|uniref:hypothetical protein n=1 Tax=unclassified Bradyrhizobium TaxID=2631580 RepID=UPI001BAAAE9A|nr:MULTISPECIES: hypothetical protein [unclassified Bradyrhizobium]MBR1208126.1 hypothetical protein [Bradyrhizobium sp. AUGA SZCCT0124]MBR1316465.1 hypothetical protein [Bradyrhizobium sp. AUGA SZCCT0051]MBR1344640.1 hypothetical protein [Bradyrhizobium sp. AUGA SZCCT0105]MBR1359486.1 hypothetical protein [Bradyrhizobium sp. AUGA SZCCT0045]